MPVQDWSRVAAGIFHDFHHSWIDEIKRALNGGLLPPAYYALAEQITGDFGPDVLTLQRPDEPDRAHPTDGGGSVAVATTPPRVQHWARAEGEAYASKAKSVVIRHVSGHHVIAMVEIVTPGNKASERALDSFIHKAVETVRSGVHLLVIDLFPPGLRDPEGLNPLIWEAFDNDDEFVLSADQPLTIASLRTAVPVKALVNCSAVGEALPETPLFLNDERYVPLPLERTYQAAFDAVPGFWREALMRPA